MRVLDSTSNKAGSDLFLWWIYILRGEVAVEVPTIQSPNIILGSCRMPTLFLKEKWITIQLYFLFCLVTSAIPYYSRLVRHTHECLNYNALLRKVALGQMMGSICSKDVSLRSVLPCLKFQIIMVDPFEIYGWTVPLFAQNYWRFVWKRYGAPRTSEVLSH